MKKLKVIIKYMTRRLLAIPKFIGLFLSNRYVYYIIKRVLKDRLTYLEPAALIDLHNSVDEVGKEKKDGIIIEAGCALGGSALVITSSKKQIRPFYVYDIFEMIPPPSEQDGPDAHERHETIASGKSRGIGKNKYYGYEENLFYKLEKTFRDYGLPVKNNNVHLVKGLFKDTVFVNEPVALAHIDCDWYESVMICLQRIEPRLIQGGILIIDDYYFWSGSRKAVDAYFADKRERFEFIGKKRLHIIRK